MNQAYCNAINRGISWINSQMLTFCGRETVFDVLSMRRLKLRLKGRR